MIEGGLFEQDGWMDGWRKYDGLAITSCCKSRGISFPIVVCDEGAGAMASELS
jgi:hypothetical protein